MTTTDARLDRARVALEGLVGDVFGERFFIHPDAVGRLIPERWRQSCEPPPTSPDGARSQQPSHP